ncbi:MAG: symmetrical bis(5'-nucleosyl)-tetraphosphatase [Gammaproteobacteria bacterium]|nr:symmetrical bis(5'-nucleosyl)-tetraphosphatase [Gammaproteobacteria bacterium]
MAIYAIGDVQGCFDELQQLLRLVAYDTQQDELWFVGDLVNRGPKSLEVLRFIKSLVNVKIVLGNHDLHLLTLFHGQDPLFKQHNLEAVINAPDGTELINWLRKLPLLYHDPDSGFVMAHAGIYPWWNLHEAKSYAEEVERVLASDDYVEFLEHMYGNKPDCWSDNLAGNERLRFILNAFVRMRFATQDGRLDFDNVGGPEQASAGFVPWYEVDNRPLADTKIIFGHWAALRGKVSASHIYALDEGCVWGGNLTAMRLDDGERFSVACVKEL